MANRLLNEHVNFSYRNGTLVDPFLSDVSKVTLNKNHLPINTLQKNSAITGTTTITAPANYITAKIDVYYAGAFSYTIPLLFPESMSESLGANFVKENTVGSTYPIIAFSNSTSQQINLTFAIVADYLPAEYKTLESYIEAIRKMVKPKTESNSYVKGPEVYVSLGNVVFHGVCDSVSVDYQNIYRNNSFVKAEVQCQFTVSSR